MITLMTICYVACVVVAFKVIKLKVNPTSVAVATVAGILMLGGIVIGVSLNLFGSGFQGANDFLVDGLFYVLGSIFVSLLQLMVVPLVLVSLVCGVTALGDLRALGRVGGKTLGLYLITTAVAITFALTVTSVISPGEGFAIAGEVQEVVHGGVDGGEARFEFVDDRQAGRVVADVAT